MARFVFVLSMIVASLAVTSSVSAAVSSPSRLLATVVAAESPVIRACSGCGCRGGAGYRLPSGKCAPRGR